MSCAMTSPTLNARLNTYSPPVVSLFRAVVGFLFAVNGSSIVVGWPLNYRMSAGMWPGWWAGIIELVTGLLVLVGLFTRPAAFLASGTMAVAYFWQHQPYTLWPIDPTQNAMRQPMGGGELSILFCFAFFLILFIGPGSIALDSVFRRRRG
jgi:putative oxidoreductase